MKGFLGFTVRLFLAVALIVGILVVVAFVDAGSFNPGTFNVQTAVEAVKQLILKWLPEDLINPIVPLPQTAPQAVPVTPPSSRPDDFGSSPSPMEVAGDTSDGPELDDEDGAAVSITPALPSRVTAPHDDRPARTRPTPPPSKTRQSTGRRHSSQPSRPVRYGMDINGHRVALD